MNGPAPSCQAPSGRSADRLLIKLREKVRANGGDKSRARGQRGEGIRTLSNHRTESSILAMITPQSAPKVCA
ncbi:hypothetical protein MPLDJ20_130025 [Mesorhizobium plurifarium]|uniref:Uncharacterized protein n=1 Tax=Mesorhizobium plurifarium TaxID=69974 RepID=A0A090ENW1_MESPL|nr:hypothetical protein MPLDJ20_130025 [Mesorhizobium plurifarium]